MNRQDAIQNAKGLGTGYAERERKAAAKREREAQIEAQATSWAAALTTDELQAWLDGEAAAMYTRPSFRQSAKRGAAVRELRSRVN